jgi:peptide/nickel transport system substrate-binding protein
MTKQIKGSIRFLPVVLLLIVAIGLINPTSSVAKNLRYAVQSFGAETFDPTLTSVTTGLGFAGPLWDWLTTVDVKGNLSPGLATSWKSSPDAKTWTLKLRQDVKFHDGSPMTAEDVKFTLQDGFGRKKAKSSRSKQFRKKIKDVEVVDRYTVKVIMQKAWPTFAHDVSNQPGTEGIVLPKKYIEKVGWQVYGRNPIGTGAFKFLRHETGNIVEYTAVKDHWRYKPQFDKLQVMLVPEAATRVAMLRTGQVDIAGVSLDDAPGLAKKGFKFARDPQASSVRIHLYGTYYKKAGPIGKLDVRKALNLAINRDELVQTLFRGAGKPAAVFPVSELSIGYPKGLKPYPFDPAEARKLLAKAGYPNGFKIKLFSVPTGGFTLHQQVSEAVAGYWEAIGVKTDIVPTDIGAFRPLYIKRPQAPQLVGQASIFATTGRLNGASSLGIWWTKSRKILQLAENVDDLYAATQKAGTVKEIADLTEKAFRIIYSDYRSIPIADVAGILWAYGNQVGGITVAPHRGYVTPSFATAVLK